MTMTNNWLQWIISFILILASIGVITVRKPIHSSLCFLLTLLMLAALYLELSAPFIAVMQVIVYAGAILVIFVFVIVIFQDAHAQINQFKPQSSSFLISFAACTFALALAWLGYRFYGVSQTQESLPANYGTVQTLGHALYVDYFFPFEAIVLLFLVAVIGSLYIGKKELK